MGPVNPQPGQASGPESLSSPVSGAAPLPTFGERKK